MHDLMSLLQLLLWTKHVCVATLLLAAVHCPCGQPRIALPTYHFVTIVFSCKDCEGRLNDTTTESQHKVQSRLLLNVVIAQGTSILQLLPGKDQPLLVWGNSFLVLNLCFHVVNGIGGLDIQCDGLAGECLHKDLHRAGKKPLQLLP